MKTEPLQKETGRRGMNIPAVTCPPTGDMAPLVSHANLGRISRNTAVIISHYSDAAMESIQHGLDLIRMRRAIAHLRQEEISELEQKEKRFHFELHSAFDSIPLESCVAHPADQIIERALREYPRASILAWLKKFCLDESRPDFAASVLRCLGHQPNPGTRAWRVHLLEDALRMDNLEIRDAAVQTADMWDDEEMADILRSHEEPVPWLRQYIVDVLASAEQ